MEKEKERLLSNMLLFATQRHHGQFDRGGKPYILHPLKVMCTLKTDDEELQVIALGHDVVEDTDATWPELWAIPGMTKRVMEGIKALTKIRGETYGEYKKRVMSNPDAIKVKLCDLRHNSDLRRLKGITDKDVKRATKYQQFYLELTELL